MTTSFASALFNSDSVLPGLGASGAIMAVCGAYLMLYPKADVTLMATKFYIFLEFEIKAFLLILIWTGFDLYGIIFVENSQGGTDYTAHIDAPYDGYVTPNGVWVQHKMPLTQRERLMQDLGVVTVDYRGRNVWPPARGDDE